VADSDRGRFPLRPVPFALTAIAVLLSDQASKLLVAGRLTAPHDLIPGFLRLLYRENRGGAWGLLTAAPEWFRMPFFLVSSLVAIGFLFWIRPRFPLRRPVADLAFPLILGGALGNLVDRARMGYVVDFLDAFVGGWHWPTFNVADIGITVGVGLLVLDALLRAPAPAVGPTPPVEPPPPPPPADPARAEG
jgi:signal peptidase II